MTQTEDQQQQKLVRGLGLPEATALNMIDMVGIGPFLVAATVIPIMGGPQSLLAWVAGALLAFIDGFIWAELGAAMPLAGGSYIFLREAYGRKKWGRMMSFLYIWQTTIQAPLVIASGAIGFANYLRYVIPSLTPIEQKGVSGLLVITLTLLLYRKVSTIGKISLVLWGLVIGTIGWLIVAGAGHFNAALAFDYPPGAFDFSAFFWLGLGQATVQTIYSYLGYYNVCHLGGEIQNPGKNIPRSIFISIAGIAVLYLAMQLSILGVVPWREGQHSEFIVSLFFEKIYGHRAAIVATCLILGVAFSSLFAAMLGYSRVPFAAAADGAFFPIFARVHPTKKFPHVSLLILGATAFVFSLLFKLKDVITAIIAVRILVQFIGQAVGVMVLRRREGSAHLPFRMWLYPLPAILAILIWGAIFLSTGWVYMVGGVGIIILGIFVFLAREGGPGAFLKRSSD
ncbi:MAG: amino acid permease-associated protein [Chlorobi bacterium]|nr:amino acid permease-associated protein [Chlorobiota bacterium]